MYLAEISPTSLRGAVTTTLFPLIIIVIVIVIVILTNWQTHSDLGFHACLAAGHRLPAHHHNVHSPLAGDLIALVFMKMMMMFMVLLLMACC